MDQTELERKIEELEQRLKFVEERTIPERTLNHTGIAVIPGSCLSGGGTIDGNLTIAFDMGILKKGKPSTLSEVLVYEADEKEYFACSFVDFMDCLIKASWVPQRLDGIERIVHELQRKVALFSIYERLHNLESTVELMECEVQELKDQADEEARQDEA